MADFYNVVFRQVYHSNHRSRFWMRSWGRMRKSYFLIISLKSDSTYHFFRNACTKSGSLRFSQFSDCWLILSVYILMSFDFPFVRLFGVRLLCYYPYLRIYYNTHWNVSLHFLYLIYFYTSILNTNIVCPIMENNEWLNYVWLRNKISPYPVFGSPNVSVEVISISVIFAKLLSHIVWIEHDAAW